MKRAFQILLASIAVSGNAHAELYTFEYTAKVGSILEVKYSGGETNLQSVTTSGSPISIGDTVTGRISYDSHLPIIRQETRFDDALIIDYGRIDSLQISTTFETAGVSFTTEGYKFGGKIFYPTGSPQPDAFYVGSYHYTFAADYASQESLGFDFADSTHSKLDLSTIPGANAATFDSNSFFYTYDYRGAPSGVQIRGPLTSLRLISAVPEPSTYAMLLVGMLLVGWRRMSTRR
jgi:hypothetical protein